LGFGAIFVLCLIWGELLVALAVVPSILMAWWLLCDEQDITELSKKLDTTIREAGELKKDVASF
jgi:hypothetical protein